MKKLNATFLSLVFFLIAQFGYSQMSINPNKPTTGKAQLNYQSFIEKCSPKSAILISEYEQAKNWSRPDWRSELKEEFSLFEQEEQLWVGAFMRYNDRLNFQELAQKGIRVKRYENNIATVQMPLELLEGFIAEDGVEFLQIGEAVHQKLDAARAATNVDQVHQGLDLPQGYSGAGVLVGIMDSGFDYTHPTFYTVDGSGYRIHSIWDEVVEGNGNPPSGFGYGTEVTGATQVLDWANDNVPENGTLVSRGSHGTHVAGIAGGSGQATNGLYTGVAYNSDLAMVAYNGSDQGFADGISYLFQKADQLGQPCVINMSLGKHIGPHDGTSFFDQIADQISGPGKILVGAAGNEGEDALHLQTQFSGAEETIYSFLSFKGSQVGTDGAGEFDIWGSPNSDFKVAINFYDITQNGFVAWTDYIESSASGSFEYTLSDNDGDQAQVNIAVVPANPNNNKPNILIQIDNSNQDDSDIFVMFEIIGTSGTVDAWSDDLFFVNNGFNPPVLAGDSNSTCGEIGGTANSVITVGAYTSKNQFETATGDIIQIPAFTDNGDLAPFSSLGPTADGRTKPEITAPGNVVVSSFSRFDPEFTLQHPRVVGSQSDGTNTWFYGAYEGTSMATPMVTGIIALMLEANPELDYQDVKSILGETAIHDQFTGGNVTNSWGWGKINAWDAVREVVLMTGTHDLHSFSDQLQVAPNPASNFIALTFMGQTAEQIRILDLSGRQLYSVNLSGVADRWEMPLPEVLPSGMYLVEVANTQAVGVQKLIVSR